jgi:hypothetical protein
MHFISYIIIQLAFLSPFPQHYRRISSEQYFALASSSSSSLASFLSPAHSGVLNGLDPRKSLLDFLRRLPARFLSPSVDGALTICRVSMRISLDEESSLVVVIQLYPRSALSATITGKTNKK